MHTHHVQMRALTGERGVLVDLCGGCHTDLHAIAAARVSVLRGGKSKQCREWPYRRVHNEPERAEYLIQELVRVMMVVDSTHLPKKMSLDVPADVSRGITLLKSQWGASNKSQVVLACVLLVLKKEGLLNK
jgi:hypothetical protein